MFSDNPLAAFPSSSRPRSTTGESNTSNNSNNNAHRPSRINPSNPRPALLPDNHILNNAVSTDHPAIPPSVMTTSITLVAVIPMVPVDLQDRHLRLDWVRVDLHLDPECLRCNHSLLCIGQGIRVLGQHLLHLMANCHRRSIRVNQATVGLYIGAAPMPNAPITLALDTLPNPPRTNGGETIIDVARRHRHPDPPMTLMHRFLMTKATGPPATSFRCAVHSVHLLSCQSSFVLHQSISFRWAFYSDAATDPRPGRRLYSTLEPCSPSRRHPSQLLFVSSGYFPTPPDSARS